MQKEEGTKGKKQALQTTEHEKVEGKRGKDAEAKRKLLTR